MVANIALAAHVLPRREHLWDIRDYRYVQVEATWVFVIVALPSVMLLLLLPVVISGNVIRRWLAVSLAVFPGFLAAAGWMQLFLVWAGSR